MKPFFSGFTLVPCMVGLSLQILAASQWPDRIADGIAKAFDELSPAALCARANGTTLYIACARAQRVLFYDVPSQSVVRTVAMPAPSGLVLSQDESRLYVTSGSDISTVCVVDTATGEILFEIPAGHSALAPVLSWDESVLYLCHRFENRVSAIDLAVRQECWRVTVAREPIGAALTADGSRLLVANHLHHRRSDHGNIGAVVSVVRCDSGQVEKEIQLPRGSGLLRGIAISPDGKFAAVTHLLGRYYLPPTEVDMGRINCNAVSLIDLKRMQWFRVVLLDFAGRGAANPWAVAWTPDSRSIVVSHAGSHELSIIDVPAVPQKPAKVQRRISLPGNGPRSLTIVGSQVYAANYFSDDVSVVDLNTPNEDPTTMSLGGPGVWSTVRRGEALFNDGTLCYQHWQSCASCHDADARIDALNWDLLNDGTGNAKNAKSLLWAHRTPPAMALGVRTNAESAVRAGLRFILFSNQSEEVAEAIDEYLRSLQPAPSPFLVDGQLSNAALHGRSIFRDDQVGCARCHPEPLFTDQRKHGVGTHNESDQSADRFDTPTLVELWRTAPYLHDGSAQTLLQLFKCRNGDDRHGKTSHLTARELDDLVAYLLSL